MNSFLCLGSNYYGQLGLEQTNCCQPNVPTLFGSSVDPREVKLICCGPTCTFIVRNDGTVLVTGTINGIVFRNLSKVNTPYPLKFRSVACGRKHVLGLMEGGYVLSWGMGYFGQLGHGDENSWEQPRLIHFLKPTEIGCQVTSIACGFHHSIAITEEGRAFSWGFNKNCQSGTGIKADTILSPRPVSLQHVGPVSKVVCGRNHSAVLTRTGRLYTWGASGYGRLGLADTPKNVPIPTEIVTFARLPAKDVSSGDFHMIALCEENSVYSWGCGITDLYVFFVVLTKFLAGFDGQTGQGHMFHLSSPRIIEQFAEIDVVKIACGPNWSIAVDESGTVYGWGNCDGGWLGFHAKSGIPFVDNESTENSGRMMSAKKVRAFDSRLNILVPLPIDVLANQFVSEVSCGGCHVIFTCRPRDGELDENHILNLVKNNRIREIESLLVSVENSHSLLQLVNHQGSNALLVACQHGHVEIVSLLLKAGADPNVPNDLGNTCLHYCYAYGFTDVARLLIDHGADEYRVNNEGLTCYEGLTIKDLDDI